MGCSTAYQLAKRGEPVCLVEQFPWPHTLGSSHGAARIIRHSYADPRYARLMVDAFGAWRDFEADAGKTVYLKCGGISYCPEPVDYVERVAESLKLIDIPHRRMRGEELRRNYPQFEVPLQTDAVFEPDAGIILAETSLALFVGLARRFGGDRFRFLDSCPIRRIDFEGDRPALIGDDITIVADRLIVTAGPWVARLLPDWSDGLTVTRQQVVYLRPPEPSGFQVGRFPVFVYMGAEGEDPFYGMPAILSQDVKIARHRGEPFDPDRLDRPFDLEYDETIRHYLRWNLPSLADAEITAREVCLYTQDPSENFRVGALPNRPEVLAASPCSGHGFKFSALIGRVLADLATKGETSVDITPWQSSAEKRPTPAP